jgi:hypothetical protein
MRVQDRQHVPVVPDGHYKLKQATRHHGTHVITCINSHGLQHFAVPAYAHRQWKRDIRIIQRQPRYNVIYTYRHPEWNT